MRSEPPGGKETRNRPPVVPFLTLVRALGTAFQALKGASVARARAGMRQIAAYSLILVQRTVR